MAVPEQTIPRSSLHFAPTRSEALGIELDCVVVALRGALTAANAATIRRQLFALAVDAGPKDLLLDLSQVSAIDHAAADVLVVVQRLQHHRRRALEIEAVSMAVTQFLLRHPAVDRKLRRALGAPESWPDHDLDPEPADCPPRPR